MGDTVTISVAQGGLRGRKVTTKAGIHYYSFQGIPYAKPPVGELRFKAPEPAEPWDGVRDALAQAAVAAQNDTILGKGLTGSEDCLFLNVYTPKLPTDAGDTLRPVMVWVHGGGFIIGSGNSDMYGPDYLMAGDVVLVTFNYRLGPLGFLSTGDSEVPGNSGLKDQIMALRWVQLNIARFGGDPGKVTVFGESAGGASVHYLMLSPMSKGLFHHVIAQSGVANNPWAFSTSKQAREKAFTLGEALGCKTDCSKELVQFLRKVPSKELLEGVDKVLGEEGKHPIPLSFAPNIEEKGNEETFLPDNPINIMTEGKFNHVPLILGHTAEEGKMVLKDAIESPDWYETLNDNFEKLLTRFVDFGDEEKTLEIAKKVKKFYFEDKRISEDTYKQYADFYSYFWFLSGIYTSAKTQVVSSKAPIYMYRFAHDGAQGFSKVFLKKNTFPGTSHGDDLGYLFHMIYHDELNLSPEDESMQVTSKIVKLWTNFARTGNPTPDGDLGVKWKPISKTDLSYLNIDKELSMATDTSAEHLKFWEDIFAAV